MPEVHRPQNGIIDLVPTVIQHGSQNLHDEVQMAGQNEWLRGVPFGHVQQSLTLWLVVTLKLWMLPSPCKYFYSCCIFQIKYSILQTKPCMHPNCNSFYPVHITVKLIVSFCILVWPYMILSISANLVSFTSISDLSCQPSSLFIKVLSHILEVAKSLFAKRYLGNYTLW